MFRLSEQMIEAHKKLRNLEVVSKTGYKYDIYNAETAALCYIGITELAATSFKSPIELRL